MQDVKQYNSTAKLLLAIRIPRTQLYQSPKNLIEIEQMKFEGRFISHNIICSGDIAI